MSSLYGRKFKLQIVLNPKVNNPNSSANTFDTVVIEQDGFSPESLRVTFDIDYPGYQGWYFSEITIYNFNQQTLMRVIEEGAAVYLEAGYQNGPYGEIFSGYVFQSLFERENITDYKLTLRCIDGAGLFDDNFISTALDAGHTATTRFNAITAYSQIPISTGKVTSQLGQKECPRAAVIHCLPTDGIREILGFESSTKAPNNQMYVKGGQVNIVNITDKPDQDVIVISPGAGGLIGTPVQTNYGANFTCLLNPSISLSNPRKLVKLDMTTVKQMRAEVGSGPLSILDLDQELQVIGVRHNGDTRGEEWYTNVTALNRGGMQPIGYEGVTQRELPQLLSNDSYGVN